MRGKPVEKIVLWGGAAGLFFLGLRLARLLAVAAYLLCRQNEPGKAKRQVSGA